MQKRDLVEANSRLSTSDALLAIAGPAAAGGLVQLLGAARVILIDAISYLAVRPGAQRVSEEEAGQTKPRQEDESAGRNPQSRLTARSIRREIAEGIYELLRTPLLRALTISSSLGMLAGAVTAAVQMLFLVHQLNFTPALIGTVLACGGAGSLLGAWLSTRAARILQVGGTLILGKLLWIAGSLLLASADQIGSALAAVGAALALGGVGSSLYFVNQISLRQSITSVRLLGG